MREIKFRAWNVAVLLILALSGCGMASNNKEVWDAIRACEKQYGECSVTVLPNETIDACFSEHEIDF